MELSIYLSKGQQNIIDNLKISLFQKEKEIFDYLNFDNDEMYKESLIYAHLLYNQNNPIDEIKKLLIGYHKKSLDVSTITDSEGTIYLPNIGWLKSNFPNKQISFHYNHFNNKVNNCDIEIVFEKTKILNDNFELLSHPIKILENLYFTRNFEKVDVEISQISAQQQNNLEIAYKIIEANSPQFYNYLKDHCKKCVIFDVDFMKRNSFASLSIPGISFYNAYQKDYNEVFFLDDIAHQNSHNLLNIIINGQKDFFRIDKNVVVDSLKDNDMNVLETRSLEIVYHSLFTYYWTFTILDDFLKNYNKNDLKLIEARARICFYIYKCYMDIQIFENTEILKSDINLSLNSIAIEIYNSIKEKYKYIYNKYKTHFDKFNFKNQPYNFTIKNFLESNEI